METKKSFQADLEHSRTSAFLLGLVMVLSVVFSALEYTSRPDANSHDTGDIDDMAEDLELLPAMDTKDMIAVAPTQGSKAITERIRAVDQPAPVDNIDKINQDNADKPDQGVGAPSATAKTEDQNETTALSPVAVDENDNPLNFRIVEQLPEFPGGMVEFMKWLTRNLKYPALAQQQKIQGKVVVSFIVNKDGSIANAKVDHSVDPLLDREALRVIKMMPRWKPGLENDKPCRTLFSIPIVFKL